jgi:Flp pilus assembly pilin Flp
MSLAASSEAIGAVSELLKVQLAARTGINAVAVGRPEDASKAAAAGAGSSFNLFLYRIGIDGNLRNHPLDAGQAPPVWLVLHYLLTAFDGPESDSTVAHKLLSRGMVALNALSVIRPDASNTVLASNPDPLRLTFDEADVELLSKIMQGSDEKYRVSAAFQVRPVMLAATDAPPDYALPVRTIGKPLPPPLLYEGALVLPSLGAQVSAIEPERFSAGQKIILRGTDLAGYDQIMLGASTYAATSTEDGALATTIPLADTITAGTYPACVARVAAGHTLCSNAVAGHLLPRIVAVALAGPLNNVLGKLSGSFTVNGSQLGGPDAAIYAAFYLHGKAQLLIEPQPGGSATTLTFAVSDTQALLPDPNYRVILRVNGEQALDSPVLSWT